MPELRCEAVRLVDDSSWPPVIEVQFVDAAGQRWSLIDKSVFFEGFDELTPDVVYPVEVRVRCVFLADASAGTKDTIVQISTASPDGVETPDGRDTFTVERSQLIL